MLILEMSKMDVKIVSLRSESNWAQTREEMVVLNEFLPGREWLSG